MHLNPLLSAFHFIVLHVSYVARSMFNCAMWKGIMLEMCLKANTGLTVQVKCALYKQCSVIFKGLKVAQLSSFVHLTLLNTSLTIVHIKRYFYFIELCSTFIICCILIIYRILIIWGLGTIYIRQYSTLLLVNIMLWIKIIMLYRM